MNAKEPRQQIGGVSSSIVKEQIVGNSEEFIKLKTTAENIARRHSTVLILGQTGTGKEMIAKHIHQLSDRANEPFVPVDCASVTESIFESEMFGHTKGAFTGALRDSLGFIRAADKGTLFLDEIGELSLSLQAKLLRVFQERKVIPVGDTQPRDVNVRIICATNRNLEVMVQNKTFREDLFFRLSVVTITMPSLCQRGDDILLLADYFLNLQADIYGEKKKELYYEAKEALRGYNWPGNIRQLANVMENAHVVSLGQQIFLDDLSLPFKNANRNSTDDNISLTLDEIQRQAIIMALKQADYCKARASRLLDVNIQRFNRMIKRLGIQIS